MKPSLTALRELQPKSGQEYDYDLEPWSRSTDAPGMGPSIRGVPMSPYTNEIQDVLDMKLPMSYLKTYMKG